MTPRGSHILDCTHVLVVTDDPNFKDDINFLATFCYHVVIAKSNHEVMESLSVYYFTAVIIDIDSNIDTGLLHRRVREVNYNTIIMLTSDRCVITKDGLREIGPRAHFFEKILSHDYLQRIGMLD